MGHEVPIPPEVLIPPRGGNPTDTGEIELQDSACGFNRDVLGLLALPEAVGSCHIGVCGSRPAPSTSSVRGLQTTRVHRPSAFHPWKNKKQIWPLGSKERASQACATALPCPATSPCDIPCPVPGPGMGRLQGCPEGMRLGKKWGFLSPV